MAASTALSESPDRRQLRRLKTFLAGTLCSPGAASRVQILNLSANGALCDGPDQPSAGTSVMLGFVGLSLFARVAWVREGRFGLRFDLPIDAGVIRLVIQRAAASEATTPLRAGMPSTGDGRIGAYG